MSGFWTLVKIENRKLYHRASTLVMAVILAALIIGITGLIKYIDTDFPQFTDNAASSQNVKAKDWKTQLQQELITDQQQLSQLKKSSDKLSETSIGPLKMKIAKDEYMIAHGIKPDSLKSVWSKMNELDTEVNPNFAVFIALFAIIAGSAAVAGEFGDGTMKMMIPRPFSRCMILSAKLASVVLYSLLLFAETFVFTFAMMGLWFGFQGFGSNILFWTGGKIVLLPAFLNTLAVYGLDFLQVFVYIVLSFAISIVSRSRAIATGISLFLLLVGGSISELLTIYFGWGKYILFGVSDFSSYVLKGTLYPGTSLGFGFVVSAVYTMIFLFAGYATFLKRDI